MSVSLDDRVTLTIRDLAYGGDGVARTSEGQAVFVPFTAVGDDAVVRITDTHRTFARGVVEEIVTPGPGRCEPVCPHYGRCGGCRYQHLTEDAEREAKAGQLRSLLERVGGQSDCQAPDTWGHAPSRLGYRNKLRLEPDVVVEGDGERAVDYGYCEMDNRTRFRLDRCPLAPDDLNGLLRKAVRSKWGRTNARRPRPLPVTLRRTRDGDLWFYFGRAPRRIPWLQERVGDRTLRVPLGSFWQVNADVTDQLVAEVTARVADAGGETLVDAYAGVGTFSVLCADTDMPRVVIESEHDAVEAAKLNHRDAGCRKVRCREGRAEAVMTQELRRLKGGRATVVLDPPRAGCHADVIRALRDAHHVAGVVYVSCDPGTLARDVKRLCADGVYALRRTGLFEMFPLTAHFETVAFLTRG